MRKPIDEEMGEVNLNTTGEIQADLNINIDLDLKALRSAHCGMLEKIN